MELAIYERFKSNYGNDFMSTIGYLLAANVVVWAGVCGYLGLLGLQQRRIKQRLTQLELIRDENNE